MAAHSPRGLTEQQYRFAEEYAVDLDSKAAAIRAGYSLESAGPAASRLLKDDRVQAVLAKAQARFAQRCDITKAWVVAEVKATYEDAKGSIDETGKIITPSDFTARLRALELMAKLNGYLVEATRTVRVIKGVEDLSEAELLAIAEEQDRPDDDRMN